MKNVKKLVTVLFAVLAFCLVVKVSPEAVQAATCVELKEGKVYTGYDFTCDGKKDKFKYVIKRDNGEAIARVYINGKLKGSISLLRGGCLYRCTSSKINNFLIASMGQFGGSTCAAYRYYGGKFRQIYGFNKFGVCSMEYLQPYKMSSKYLYMQTYTGKSFGGTFDSNYSRGAAFRITYKVGNGKIALASRYGIPFGNKTYTAKNSFRTSTSATSMNTKGPVVKKGQKVMLNRVYFHKTKGVMYRIVVNGKYAWIKDSKNTVLM